MSSRAQLVEAMNAAEAAAQGSSDPPEFLYHYTNGQGLEGILRSRTLRATQIDCLNDTTELVYGFQVMRECFKRAAMFDEFRFQVIDEVEKDLTENEPHYVASFCEDGDLLSQWRGYAQSSDGYAIGFRSSRLRARPSQIGRQLQQIIYSRGEQDRRLGIVVDAIKESAASAEGLDARFVHSTATSIAFRLLFRFKHELFSGEREWRLIAFSSDETPEKFRMRNGYVTPYIEIPLEASDIDVIVQGPGTHRRGNLAAVLRFAESCGFTPRVVNSAIPLV